MTGPGSQAPFYGSNSIVPTYLLANNINANRMGRKVVARYEEIKANQTKPNSKPKVWDATVKMCHQHEGHKKANGTNQKLISTSEM